LGVFLFSFTFSAILFWIAVSVAIVMIRDRLGREAKFENVRKFARYKYFRKFTNHLIDW
jgi:hypothetical protein